MSVNRAFFEKNPAFAQSMDILDTGNVDLEEGFTDPTDPRMSSHNRAFLSPVQDVVSEMERRRNTVMHQQRQQSYEASRWSGIYGGAGYGVGSFLSQAGIPGGGAMGRMASMARMGGQVGVGMSMMGIGQGKLVKNEETGRMMMEGGLDMAKAVPAIGAFIGALSLGTQGLKAYTTELMETTDIANRLGMQGSGGIFSGYSKGTALKKDMSDIRFANEAFYSSFDKLSEEEQGKELMRATEVALQGKRFGNLAEFEDVDTAKWHVLATEFAAGRPETQPAAFDYLADVMKRASRENVVAGAEAMGASLTERNFEAGFGKLASGGVRSIEQMSAPERMALRNQLVRTENVTPFTASNLVEDVYGKGDYGLMEQAGTEISNLFKRGQPGFMFGMTEMGQNDQMMRGSPEYDSLLAELKGLRGDMQTAFRSESGYE